jgi:hypothetical protein
LADTPFEQLCIQMVSGLGRGLVARRANRHGAAGKEPGWGPERIPEGTLKRFARDIDQKGDCHQLDILETFQSLRRPMKES